MPAEILAGAHHKRTFIVPAGMGAHTTEGGSRLRARILLSLEHGRITLDFDQVA